MAIEIKLLRHSDAGVLENVAPDVFDHPIDRDMTREFLADARHHLAVAVDDGLVVGFASAVHYAHPDKRRELWVNEVAVAPTHRGRGIGKRLLTALFDAGRQAGCVKAWVLTDRPNLPAVRLYASMSGSESPNDHVVFTFSLSADADSPKVT